MGLSRQTAQATGKPYPVDLLCELLEVPKSSYYEYRRRLQEQRRGERKERKRPGPKVQVDDDGLLVCISEVLADSPFYTEGVRKVHARLRRRGVRVARERVNRVMRQADLLSPQRIEQEKNEKNHDGTIIPDTINRLWGTDATMFGTADGRLYWLFAVIDHYSDEVLGVHVVEQGCGDRWAALEPIKQALRTVCGAVGKTIGDGIAIRHDWGPQYIAKDFKNELSYLGLGNSPAFQHEPETNGVMERFFRTLKWECLWIEHFLSLDDARSKIAAWIEAYNSQWLIGRHGHRTPREVREACEAKDAAMAVA
jgi:transposase InsO family protein